MSRQEEDYKIGVYDDPLIKAIHHVDDGRDYTQRIIHDMRQRYYIRAGIYPVSYTHLTLPTTPY